MPAVDSNLRWRSQRTTGRLRIDRDLRYWTSRHSTAQIERAPKDTTAAHFGCTVTIARDDGRQQSYRIVGEDEADPSRGTMSYWPSTDGEAGGRCGARRKF